VECCMKRQVGNEKLPEWVQAHQKGHMFLIISSKISKTNSLYWTPTGIVVCHTDTTLYKDTRAMGVLGNSGGIRRTRRLCLSNRLEQLSVKYTLSIVA
jgi:hypothetical protein